MTEMNSDYYGGHQGFCSIRGANSLEPWMMALRQQHGSRQC